MVAADVLSWHADWSKGLEHDNEEVVTLPENLWIRLLDMELWDTVLEAAKTDNLALEAMKFLSSADVSPTTWTFENPGSDSSTPLLFYNGCLYIPDSLDLQRQIVKDYHDTPVAGHTGILATY